MHIGCIYCDSERTHNTHPVYSTIVCIVHAIDKCD